ncbi:MAG: tetratricopeptide repeat protein [Saprospiraceae bacterium]|nr:tetratricopeptide repeat protein [Saprospiraceae bacterium]
MNAKAPHLPALTGIWFCAIMTLGGVGAVDAQSAHKLLREGDAFYDKKEFAEAEKSYRKAEAAGKGSDYNLGNTLMQQERYPEAVKAYGDAVQKAGTAAEKADALHNQGNAYFQMKDYTKSIDSYKQALTLDAESADTRENLALAKWQLKKQQQQEQQRQQQNKEQQQQEKQEEKQQQPQDKGKQQQQSSGDKNLEKESPNQEDPTPQNSQNKPSAADEKLLQLMDQEERRVQQKWHQRNGKKKPRDKDW